MIEIGGTEMIETDMIETDQEEIHMKRKKEMTEETSTEMKEKINIEIEMTGKTVMRRKTEMTEEEMREMRKKKIEENHLKKDLNNFIIMMKQREIMKGKRNKRQQMRKWNEEFNLEIWIGANGNG